jgi:superfamily II DNA or RNA helicase
MIRVDAVIRGTNIQPRPYQKTIVTKVTDMLGGRYVNGGGETEAAARSVMIESPTGSGKTVMGFVAARMLQRENPGMVIGWVAMRRDLLRQAAKANKTLGIDVPDIHFVSMFDKRPEKLVEAKEAGRPLLMVVDEAQHDAANSMAHLHNILEPEKILGLTATPFRTDRVKLCFDKVVKDAGIHQLIQDGYLSPYDHYSIPQWDVETVGEFYLREPQRWGRSIFYFLTKEECRRFRTILLEAGQLPRYEKALRDKSDKDIQAFDPIVDGDSNRELQIDAYLNGATDKLVNCMVLTEGFDDPSLQTAWVRDSVKGPTMQMGGRVFRQFPDLAAKNIVQSRQTGHPMIKTAMPRDQYLWQSDEWRSLTVNPHLAHINNQARMAIAKVDVEMPKYIQTRKGRGRTRRVSF